MTNANGILCLNKDVDMTSFLCCSVMRGLLKTKKIGHGGTLDPNATGVLPILCGNATKAMDILPVSDKRYIADFQLGCVSDTQDVWGNVETVTDSFPCIEKVKEALTHFVGSIEQLPPMMSALKKDGVRLYTLARQGIEVEREKRAVTVYSCSLMDYDENTGKGKIDCFVSKGTYIRTICHDLGQLLKTGAIMTSLCRTMAAGFTLEECKTLEELRHMSLEERFALIKPVDTAFSVYPAIHVTAAQGTRFQNGGFLSLDRLSCPVTGTVRVYANNLFLGLGKPKEEQLYPLKLFPIVE